MKSNVIQALTTIPDPRRRCGRHSPLFGLLAIVLRAAMHGERSFRGMWLWARARQDDLRTHPALGVRAVRRIPSLATFGSAVRTTPAGERARALAPRCRRNAIWPLRGHGCVGACGTQPTPSGR